MSGLKSCNTFVEVLNTCPADTEQILFFNAATETGMALREWGKVKSCLISSIFGVGVITITGDDLDADNIYLNSGLIDNLLIFYNGLGRYLNDGEWQYEVNGGGSVVGIQILIDAQFTSADIFLIIPNPKNT